MYKLITGGIMFYRTPLRCGWLCVLMFGILYYQANAKINLDSVSYFNSTITKISDFNGDYYNDTLVSVRINNMFIPYFISWASKYNVPAKTYFKLPDYESYSISSNCLSLNNDNLEDLLFSVVTYKKNQDGRVVLDTAYHTVVFAQPGLSTLDTISIEPVVGIVYSPIIKMDYNAMITSKIRSDYSGDYAFTITKQNISTMQKQSESNDDGVPIVLELYPNPVTSMLSVGIKNLSNNVYSYKIMNSIGETIENQTINKLGSSVNQELLMERYASGIYLFALYSNSQVIALKTFIVSK